MNTSKIPLVGALVERLRKRSDTEIVEAATASRGDVTRVRGYDQLKQCLDRLVTIDGGSGSLGRPLRAARGTHEALLKHRPAFAKAYASGGSEAVRLSYAQAVAGLWHVVSLLCAQGFTIGAAKGGLGSGHALLVNPDGIVALSGTIPVTRLEQFVEASAKYGFSTAVAEGAPMIEREALLGEDLGMSFGIAVGAVAVVAAVVYAARDLAEYFYHLRGSMAKWLDMQASFLEMNASQLAPAHADARAKQLAYAERFRSLADRLRIEAAGAEREARRDLASAAPAASSPVGQPSRSFAQSTGSGNYGQII